MLRSPPVRGRRPNMQHPIMRDCVGFWPFNEGTGEKVADLSGSNLGGTFSGAPIWAPGKLGTGLKFDGTDDYVSVPGYTYPQSSPVTVSIWVKATATPANYDAPIGCTYANWIGGSWTIRWNTTGGKYEFWIDRYDTGNAVGASVDPTEWHHIAGTYDGSTVRIYVDGIEGTPKTYTSLVDSISALQIGSTVGVSARNFPGIIQNVLIRHRCATAQEVRNLYRYPWLMFDGFRVPILVSGTSTPTTISATKGEVRINALQPTLNVSTKVNVTVGTVRVTSRPVSINAETSMSAGVGRVLVNALQPTLTTANAINVGIGRVLINAMQPTVTATGDTSISVGKGEVLVNALQPTISAETICNVTVGTVRVTSRPVSINAETICNVTVGTVVVSALSIDFSDGTGVGELMLGDVSVRPTLLGSAMINTNNRLWISEDNNVKLTGLRLDSDASYVNDATASFVVTGTTGNVIGSTGTTMSYTTGTNGNYLGVFPSTDAANLAEDTEYYVAITASSSNNDLYRKHKVLAAYHGFEDV